MSYTTNFSVEYKFEEKHTVGKERFNDAIAKGIRANYEKIAKENATRQETQNDWFDFIVNDDGKYISNAYSNLNVLIDIACQFIRDELTNQVEVVFEWDGEESGDWTQNVYHVRQVMNLGETSFEITREKEIVEIVEVLVDVKEKLFRE